MGKHVARLQSEQDLLLMLLDSVLDYGIFWADPEGRVRSWNAGAEKITGYSRDEILGKHVGIFYREEDRRSGLLEFELRKATVQGRYELEGWRRRKDGSLFWASAVMTALRAPDGTLLGIGKITRDMTEQHDQQFMREALEFMGASLDYKATLQRLADLAAQHFKVWCSVHVLERDQVRSVAAAYIERAQTRRGIELLKRFPVNLNAPAGVGKVIRTGEAELVEKVTAEMTQAIARDPDHLSQLRQIEGGSYLCVPVKSEERTIGAITLFTNERVFGRRELMLLQALAEHAVQPIENASTYHRARQAIQDRESVLAIASHDLKNPVSSILIASAFLMKTAGATNPTLKKQLEVIHRSAKRMTRMISDFLDLSQLEEGRLVLHRTSCNVKSLIAELMETLQPIAIERGVSLTEACGECIFEGDHDRLLQVFSNLVGNALKFTDRGGRVEVSLRGCGRELLFAVSDTGPGISREDIPKVFMRFWQGKSTKREGAGLGLSIARGIVEAHGGRIWVESAHGKGATFYFKLPKKAA